MNNRFIKQQALMKKMAGKSAHLTLQVEGIMCSGCALDTESILLDTDGILEASVNFADGTLAVTYDPAEISEKNIMARVRKLGFMVTKIEHK
jgi:copper chaperone CopZ